MSISKDNIQTTSILRREIVERIDVLAEENMRTRSSQIAYIINEYFKIKDKEEEEDK